MDTFEQLLGGEELYHYHSKLMMKEVKNITRTAKKRAGIHRGAGAAKNYHSKLMMKEVRI